MIKFNDVDDFEGVFKCFKLLCLAIPINNNNQFGIISHPLITSSIGFKRSKFNEINSLKEEDYKDKEEFEVAKLKKMEESRYIIDSNSTREEIVKLMMEELEFVYKHCDKNIDKLFLIFVNKPYYIELIDLCKTYLTRETYTKLLYESWIDVEFPHQMGTQRLIRMFNDCDRDLLKKQSEESAEEYDSLPQTITVYRGLQGKKAKCKGLSWTIDLEKARWFANRWDFGGRVYSAEIEKRDVFFYTNDRGEREVVVNPMKLKKIMLVEK